MLCLVFGLECGPGPSLSAPDASPHAAGETGTAEAFGARERQEMSNFLDACMQTAPVQYVHRLLAEKARCPCARPPSICATWQSWAQYWPASQQHVPDLHGCARQQGLMGQSPQQWKDALFQMWFALYKREVANDTSGFEHTFVGEVDKRENCIKGMHNWVQWYIEESRGNVQYHGYLNPRQ